MTNAELRAILDSIGEASGGVNTPESIVLASRPADHPLHGEFVWDNKAAGHEYRLEQARRLMRRVRYVSRTVHSGPVRVPHYVHSPALDRGEAGYVAITSVERNTRNARVVLDDEMMRVVGAIRRANAVATQLGCGDVPVRLTRLLAEAEAIRAAIGEAEAGAA